MTGSKIEPHRSLVPLVLSGGLLREPQAGKTRLKFSQVCLNYSGWINRHHTEPGLLGMQPATVIVAFKAFSSW